jgi:hypothetical protein
MHARTRPPPQAYAEPVLKFAMWDHQTGALKQRGSCAQSAVDPAGKRPAVPAAVVAKPAGKAWAP